MSARHRLSKLLLRHGLDFDWKTTWGPTEDRWLRQQRSDALAGAGSGTLAAFDAGYDSVGGILARRDRLDRLIGVIAKDSPFTPVTNRLCACVGSRP